MEQAFYKCIDCGKEFPLNEKHLVCDVCSKNQKPNEPLRGILEVKFKKPIKIFNSADDFLPIEKEFLPNLKVGNTPLISPKRISDKYGFTKLYLKNDGLNPTGSFKDRASYLVAAFAKKWGIREIVGASTGNAGSSMAGMSASEDLNMTLFLPKTAPRGKLVQSLQYGANLILVDGNYDLAYDISLEYLKDRKAITRNTGLNPLTIEGKKTVSIELFLDLGKNTPDHVFVPTGDGVILSGVYKGFNDLLEMGHINKMPKIYAVQAEGSNAIDLALKNNGKFEPISSKTVADSISVDVPRDGYQAVRYLRKFKGETVVVSDDEILTAQQELSSLSGIFAEPAASAAYAGFLKAKEKIEKNEKIVVLLTGMGLKDVASAEIKVDFPKKAIKSLSEL